MRGGQFRRLSQCFAAVCAPFKNHGFRAKWMIVCPFWLIFCGFLNNNCSSLCFALDCTHLLCEGEIRGALTFMQLVMNGWIAILIIEHFFYLSRGTFSAFGDRGYWLREVVLKWYVILSRCERSILPIRLSKPAYTTQSVKFL